MPKATITESAIYDYGKLKFGGLITNPLLRPITLSIFQTADLIIPHDFPILWVTLSSLTLHFLICLKCRLDPGEGHSKLNNCWNHWVGWSNRSWGIVALFKVQTASHLITQLNPFKFLYFIATIFFHQRKLCPTGFILKMQVLIWIFCYLLVILIFMYSWPIYVSCLNC